MRGHLGLEELHRLAARDPQPARRREAWSILGVQLVLWGFSFALTERWWIYPVLWWLPWMTQWRVLTGCGPSPSTVVSRRARTDA